MRTPKTFRYLLVALLLIAITGCSKDDKFDLNEQHTAQGKDHTYKITFKEGAMKGAEIKGVIKNFSGGDEDSTGDESDSGMGTAAFTAINDEPDLKRINFTLKDQQVFIHGSLLYDESTGKTKGFGDLESSATAYSTLSISFTDSDRFEDFLDTAFLPVSGTCTLKDVQLVRFLGTAGPATFKLHFKGEFVNLNSEGTVPIEGDIVVSLPADF